MTFDPPGWDTAGWLLLAAGSGLLGASQARRIAGAGLCALGLALAAWRVSESARMAQPAAGDGGFLVVNGGLLLLGLGLILLGWVRAGPSRAAIPPLVLVFVGMGLVATAEGSALGAGEWARMAACALLLAMIGTGLVALGRFLGSAAPVRAVARRLFPAPREASLPTEGRSTAPVAFAAAVLVTAFAPHVIAICFGAVVAVWAARLLLPQPRPWPLAPALVLLLVPTCWLLATIAGPVGLSISDLGLVPLSPAAESAVAAGLLVAAWATTALWPLSGQLPGAVTGAVGAALLARVALPLVPNGIAQWRPLLVPIVILGLWHAAAHARWALVAVGGAVIGLVSPDPRGPIGGALLAACALALEIARHARPALLPARPGRVLLWVGAGWGGLLVLEGSLHGEVVYTALGTAGLALILAGGRVDSGPERVHIRPEETT